MASTVHPHPSASPSMPAVARILSQFDRPKLEGFITVAIGLLDVLDGDPDIETNGDELDGTNAEDEIGNATFDPWLHGGAGCPIADPGEDSADSESETWANADDHPAELFIGTPPAPHQLREE